MIFQRALRRELVSAAGAVFTTLFTILIVVMLKTILGLAAGGKVGSRDVVALIGFEVLNYVPVILILTGFISVLWVVARSYQDSEMVVWFASGLSLLDWVKPVLRFGLPIVMLTGMLSFTVTPWAIRKSNEVKESFEKREDIDKVSPGRFQQSGSGNRIFFVEEVPGDAKKVKNIFVNTVKDGRVSVVVAKEGVIEVDQRGDKFLVMQKGRRYEGVPNELDFQMMAFERYALLVQSQSKALAEDKSSRALSTPELLNDRTSFNMAELLWRAALPLMSLFLILLAIPLGFVNPRGGRSVNLIVAMLLFAFYRNMVSVFQAAVAQSKMSFALAWWPIHLLVALMIVLLFTWRLNVNSPYHPIAIWSAVSSSIKRRRTIREGAT